jgi:hypothetical protein
MTVDIAKEAARLDAHVDRIWEGSGGQSSRSGLLRPDFIEVVLASAVWESLRSHACDKFKSLASTCFATSACGALVSHFAAKMNIRHVRKFERRINRLRVNGYLRIDDAAQP